MVLDYLSGLLLPFIVWCVSPSVNLITSVRAAVLSSLYDNCYFVNIPEKTQQSIDVPQKCHCQVASWLRYTSSLQVYRVLWRKSSFTCVARETGCFKRFLAFSWHAQSIFSKCSQLRDVYYISPGLLAPIRIAIKCIHCLTSDTYKRAEKLSKASGRDFDRKRLEGIMLIYPFSKPFSSYWLFITVNRETWLNLTVIPLSSLNSCRFLI